MEDVNTQDILAVVRDADEAGESENVFFLYVATPRKPPSALHRKVIEPYLKSKGWRKVSYKNTGFRALYFLRKQETPASSQNNTTGPDYTSSHELRDQTSEVITISSNDDSDQDDFEDRGRNSQKRQSRISEYAQSSRNEGRNQIQNENISQINDVEPNTINLNATQRATNHRTELKRIIEDYKRQHELTFHVHIVLSRPIDYEEDFAEIASQPGSVEP